MAMSFIPFITDCWVVVCCLLISRPCLLISVQHIPVNFPTTVDILVAFDYHSRDTSLSCQKTGWQIDVKNESWMWRGQRSSNEGFLGVISFKAIINYRKHVRIYRLFAHY